MKPTIRRVTLQDAQVLSSLAAETFYDTFVGTCTDEDMSGYLHDTYRVEQVMKELSDEQDQFYFAEIDGVPVGYIRMKEDYEGFPLMKKWRAFECKRLYVKKEFHKKGVAQALMDFFMAYAVRHDFEVVWLGVWEFNFRAQKFYSKYGFVPNGHGHDFPIGKTPQVDIWMWKFLRGEPGTLP
jgi:ribosomal protein S18 acetylase RimI-like enzyme